MLLTVKKTMLKKQQGHFNSHSLWVKVRWAYFTPHNKEHTTSQITRNNIQSIYLTRKTIMLSPVFITLNLAAVFEDSRISRLYIFS